MTEQLGRLLANSAYSRMLHTTTDPGDPIRFFRGAAARVSDLAAGWGVKRSVLLGSAIVSFEDFLKTVVSSADGDIYVLSANTGEGKTTFLNQLALHLHPDTVVLRWSGVKHQP